jgi:hypothetical protein
MNGVDHFRRSFVPCSYPQFDRMEAAQSTSSCSMRFGAELKLPAVRSITELAAGDEDEVGLD